MPLKVFKRKFKDGTRSKTYWVRGTVKGTEVFQSTKEAGKREAEKFRDDLEAELKKRFARKDERLFFEALESYQLKGKDLHYLAKINEQLGLIPLSEISQELIDSKAREAFPTQKDSSVRRWFYDPVSAILHRAHELGWMPYFRVKKPKKTRPAPVWAELDWFETFWPYCSPQLKAITTFLPYTGCRISECLSLTWDDVNLEERWAYLPVTKNGEHRSVYLPPVVTQELLALRPQEAHGKVFPWKSKDEATKAIKRAVERCNKDRAKNGLQPIPYLSSHKIGSHTYATWMRRYGNLDAVGLVSTGRWKDHSSTYIYAHAKISDEAKKADLLPVSKRAKIVQRKVSN